MPWGTTTAQVHHSQHLYMHPITTPNSISSTSMVLPKCSLSMAFSFHPVVFLFLLVRSTHNLTAPFGVRRGNCLSETELTRTITPLFSTTWSIALFVQYLSYEKFYAIVVSWGRGSMLNPLLPSSCSTEIAMRFWQDLDFLQDFG